MPFLAERFRVDSHRPALLRPLDRAGGAVVVARRRDRRAGRAAASSVRRSAGLSLGGRLAIEIALDHPERLSALAVVAPGLAGHDGARRTPRSRRRATTRRRRTATSTRCSPSTSRCGLRSAPTSGSRGSGSRRRTRTRYRTVVEPRRPAGPPAKERLGELSVPTLVVTVSHDPPGFREIGPLIAARGAERAPRRARLRPLRHAPRAGACRPHAARFPGFRRTTVSVGHVLSSDDWTCLEGTLAASSEGRGVRARRARPRRGARRPGRRRSRSRRGPARRRCGAGRGSSCRGCGRRSRRPDGRARPRRR